MQEWHLVATFLYHGKQANKLNAVVTVIRLDKFMM